MNSDNYMIRFYPSTRIIDYPWVYFDRYETYLPKKDRRDQFGHQFFEQIDNDRAANMSY